MYRQRIIAPVLLCAILFAPVAHAATFCVATAADLQTALVTSSNNSESNTIKVQTGTYLAPMNGFRYSRVSGANAFDMQGGWNAGCTTQTPDASLSVLDGQMMTNVMDATDLSDPGGNMTIRYFTFLHGASQSGAALGAFAPGEVHVENCRFRLNNSDAATSNVGIMHISTKRGPIYFLDNMVANNSAATSNSLVGFDLGAGADANVAFYINGNTIADNTYDLAQSQEGVIFVRPDAIVSLANNIIWGNGGFAFLQNITLHLLLLNNDIQNLNVTPETGSGGNLAVDPQFVSTTNHHLQLITPLYNAGAATPVGGNSAFDLDGNPRVAFGVVDIGAYELQSEGDTIFNDGFDG